jgi:hypothetical protein
MLFDSTTGKWTELTDLSGGCPTWSRDGTFLYFQTFDVKDPAVFRVRIADRRRERGEPRLALEDTLFRAMVSRAYETA